MGSSASSATVQVCLTQTTQAFLQIFSGSDRALTTILSVKDWRKATSPRVAFTQRRWTFLHAATWTGNYALLQQLLEHQAFQLKDFEGLTPEDLARELHDSTALSLLLATYTGLSEVSSLTCTSARAQVTPRLCVEGPEILVSKAYH